MTIDEVRGLIDTFVNTHISGIFEGAELEEYEAMAIIHEASKKHSEKVHKTRIVRPFLSADYGRIWYGNFETTVPYLSETDIRRLVKSGWFEDDDSWSTHV